MAADKDIIRHLNIVLKNELTAINQYFLHARVLKHMGLMKLADYEYKASIDEMKHADMLVEHILSLGSLPNLQDLGKLFIGETVEEILACDLTLEKTASGDVRAAILACEEKQDCPSAEILRLILKSEEEHVQFLTAQMELIAAVGATAYTPNSPKDIPC